MAAPNITPPHSSNTVPPSSATVVPTRPKPPAFPAISNVTRPVIIEEDVIDYLAKAPLEQRWRILSRVAMATADETASTLASSAPPPPASDRPITAAPPPAERSGIVPAAPASEPRVIASPAPVRPRVATLVAAVPPPVAAAPAPVVAAPPPSRRSPMAVVPAPSQRPSTASSQRPVAAPPPSQPPIAAPPRSQPPIFVPPPSQRPSAAPPRSQRPPMVVVPPPSQRPSTTPPPSAERPRLELVDQTREAPPLAPPRPSPSFSRTVAARPASSAPSVPPASSAPSTPPAASAVDHAEQLFEAMHELTLFESAPVGARFCLEALLQQVPSLAGLVHLRDPASLELVVVHAQGPRADGLLRTRTPLTDALVMRAAHAGKPTVVTYGAEPGAEKTTCPRHGFFDPWSVVLVPVTHGGQLLGLFEMIDPIEGNPHDEQAQGALAYVASRLGRFLAEHGTELGDGAC